MKKLLSRVAAAALAALTLSQGYTSAASPGEIGWKSWGNGLAVNNYSPADQINAGNVDKLIPVWTREFHQRGGWEMTPIVVDGLMYAMDLEGNVMALDPETGKDVWRYATGAKGSSRAVSYWPGDATHKPRIIVAVVDRIYALDAQTGQPAQGFGGAHGYVDIREGFAPPTETAYRMSSAPTVYKNLLITGVSTQEFGSNGPPGDPRAYDAVTGKLVWSFHIVPRPGEPNFGGFGAEGWKGRSGPTTWGISSVDEKTGLVFIPVGQPADNFVGIDRPGSNLYSDSIVALDAATGKYRWHYQTVHHDLWDFDLSASPALIDLTVGGKPVPALVETTKTGLVFILDRRTGKPVFGVEERPVPQSTIPGEQTSPTQPFPIKPPPLGRLGISRAALTTITPEAHRYCTDQWNKMGLRDSPIFTPPSLAAPMVYGPANAGGAGGVWGGVSIDPRTNYIFVNVANIASTVSVVRDDGKAKDGATSSGYRTIDAFTKFMDPNGLPCIQPPWGEMVAINGNTGDIAWRMPLGRAEVYGPLGEHTGMLTYGGSLATGGGLVFIGGVTMACSQCKYDDPEVRAFDARTGLIVWRARLSAGVKSNLMTFVGRSGRQYLVTTSSGRPDTDIAMVAFALPRPGERPVDIHPAAPWPVIHPAAGGAAAPAAAGPIARAEDLPPGPGKDDFARACSACHSLATPTAMRATLGGWTTIIQTMRGRGAKVDDATQAKIAAYLAKNFGPAARTGPNGEKE